MDSVKSLTQPYANLSDLLRQASEKAPDKPHISYRAPEGIVTSPRKETARQSARCAAFLEAQGIGPGDRVGIVGEKSCHSVYAFFGVFSRGAVAVPVAEGLPAEEMGFIFQDAELALILATPAFEDKVKEAAGDIPVHTIPAALETAAEDYQAAESVLDSPACIIYTSGSTGRPKGVILTHENFLANAATIGSLIEVHPEDCLMSLLPYWHSFALTVEMFAVLRLDARLAIPRDQRDFAQHMAQYDATIILIVPRIAEMLRKNIERGIKRLPPSQKRLCMRALGNAARVCTDDPALTGSWFKRLMRRFYLNKVLKPFRMAMGPRFRYFVSGGAPLDKEHQVFFKHIGIPIYQGYGQTESTPVISAASPARHRLGASGHLASWLFPEYGGDYTFEDAQGNRGKDIKGQLLVKGVCVMQGYWRRDEETARTLRDGWLYTGDMGYLDSDGYITLSGRSTNLICLVGGEKFHPEPVEERLKTSSLVDNCVVLGECCKNAYALIVPGEEATDTMSNQEKRDLIGRDIKALLASVPGHWVPKDFVLVPPFTVENGQMTQTMKVRRKAVMAEHAQVIEGLYVRNGEKVRSQQSSDKT